MANQGTYYYNIALAYEIPYNVLDSEVPGVVEARNRLYETLSGGIPGRYEKFSMKLVLHQLQDSLNYIVSYTCFFRIPSGGLPMEEWLEAEALKKSAQSEIEAFFDSVDVEYRKVNIKNIS